MRRASITYSWGVVARQVWLAFLGRWQKQDWVPGVLETWWPGLEVVARKDRRNLHTAVRLVCWCIWKHRNAVVFDRVTPSATHIIREIGREGDAWRRAGLFDGSLLFSDFGVVDVIWILRE
ncbi:hypothetical protein BRADI_2g35255v3 [Brachypodium distachyon]|uniref:Uncharacterized protein n=1 Tax=Brachypodium distachyon TaxID=15368 RepID=A0A2K2DBW7_BRADI|nr:hypothetical protein BRADI_2g35255v3 [Brachypodium distachyon]